MKGIFFSMYLGIDFIVDPKIKPYLIEVNVGLPGGAQEYDLCHRVYLRKSSNIFSKIEDISVKVYGKKFKDYLHSLPFIESLKAFKIWIDNQGPMPEKFHPALRLEDKWIQYQLLKSLTTMPQTIIFDVGRPSDAKSFLNKFEKLVLKRRLGRGGRDFKIISDIESLKINGRFYLLQEYIESKVEGFTFSIRSVAFGGEFICMYANLSTRDYSNHGIITFIEKGKELKLLDSRFEKESFNQKSWEAEIWFGDNYPPYLKHNLFEDEVAKTALIIPEELYKKIEEISIKVERYYEALNFSSIPKACFEDRD